MSSEVGAVTLKNNLDVSVVYDEETVLTETQAAQTLPSGYVPRAVGKSITMDSGALRAPLFGDHSALRPGFGPNPWYEPHVNSHAFPRKYHAFYPQWFGHVTQTTRGTDYFYDYDFKYGGLRVDDQQVSTYDMLRACAVRAGFAMSDFLTTPTVYRSGEAYRDEARRVLLTEAVLLAAVYEWGSKPSRDEAVLTDPNYQELLRLIWFEVKRMCLLDEAANPGDYSLRLEAVTHLDHVLHRMPLAWESDPKYKFYGDLYREIEGFRWID